MDSAPGTRGKCPVQGGGRERWLRYHQQRLVRGDFCRSGTIVSSTDVLGKTFISGWGDLLGHCVLRVATQSDMI